ncbi:hypothetical protein [uncultured Parolsenella sp.]|uniref:hypothetical protein n=1 Tax=uncultured Parolsenella sp. TaxID=2083008 RepID=UPI0025EA704F|nr:hypothetical protein [uncultured Parolsenella sp.]
MNTDGQNTYDENNAPQVEPTIEDPYEEVEAPKHEQRPAFVREPRHHISQAPVNDMQADDTFQTQYSHESGYTLSNRNRISRGAYRGAQSQETKVRQELKYGQYLSVPKGSREIFGSRERQRRRTIGVATVVVALIALVVIAVVLVFFH